MSRKVFYLMFLMFLTLCSQEKIDDEGIKEVPLNPDPNNYEVELVVPDLNNPWGMCWLPDGSMLITELSGDLIHFKNGVKTEIEGVPDVYSSGQGGLMDIELHPQYNSNGWIYLTLASSEGNGSGGNTALVRAKLDGNKLVSVETLYKAAPNTNSGRHFGSRVRFDNAGYVYFSIGDRGNRDKNPQDITLDGGKIYRLHDDGRIPADNPFVNEPNAKKAIWSYGHRNPQGMILHPDGRIWTHEHGPKGGDEINIIKKGANYGWPVITYGTNYDGTPITDITEKEGMEQPQYYWVPSIAPCGMELLTSGRYPDWKGNLFIGSLKFQYLEMLKLQGERVVERTKLLSDIGRLRNVRQGPDGYLYVGVQGKGIYRILPK